VLLFAKRRVFRGLVACFWTGATTLFDYLIRLARWFSKGTLAESATPVPFLNFFEEGIVVSAVNTFVFLLKSGGDVKSMLFIHIHN
jgi:hypothetical protein